MAYQSPAKNGSVPSWNDQLVEYRSPAMTNGVQVQHYYPSPTTTSKKLPALATSDDNSLRKKLLELHAHDSSLTFDTESLLFSIQGILKHATTKPGPHFVDFTQKQPDHQIKYPTYILPTGMDGIHDTIPSLLHKITCVLKCKCSGGDGHAVAMEILQLLSYYSWETKIVIVLASFVVEFGQHSLVSTLCNTNPLAKLLYGIMQIPDAADDFSNLIKSKFEAIIRLVDVSIEVTRFIAKFGCFPSKYISNDAQPMLDALNQIPLAVYWMIRVVFACASEHSEILGQTQITTSYTETWNISSLEQKITTIQATFTAQLDLCYTYIEEKKQLQYYEKLRIMFSQTTIYVDNQKILEAIFSKKDGLLPFSCGQDVTKMRGVEALKGKTVLLLISDLEITFEEIKQISKLYNETKVKSELQYEIVWIPIVENIEQNEVLEQRLKELKCMMAWYSLGHPNFLKQGFVRYVKEEWKYSKKSIMVALDQRGKVAHLNALHMMWTWGNAAYPFTYRREMDLWSRKEWSFTLIVEDIDINISTWIKQEKVICLYGGEDKDWINMFIDRAHYAANEAFVELEMVYVCKKNARKEHVAEITNVLGDLSHVWDKSTSAYFWQRIECIMYSKVHQGAKVSGDHVLAEVLHMLTLGDSEKGWAMISQGGGVGPGQIARASGDVILNAFEEFDSWRNGVGKENFTAALHGYLAGRSKKEHHCNRLILPGIEDIPGIVACAECQRPMEKYIMYRCCTD